MILRLREGGLGGASSDGQMERSIITVPTLYVATPILTRTPYPCPNPYPHKVRRVVAYWKSRRRSLRRSRMVRLGAGRGGAAACGLSSTMDRRRPSRRGLSSGTLADTSSDHLLGARPLAISCS